MSAGAVGGVAGAGLLASLIADSAAARAQVDRLTRQSASGLVADSYGGLGTGVGVSVGLRPQLARLQAWQRNIDAVSGRLQTTQSVLGQLHDLGGSFDADALGVALQSAEGARDVAARAKVALRQVTDLLNTRAGEDYVFAGADSSSAPIDQAALANFVASVAGQVGGLGSSVTPAVMMGQLVTQAQTADFAYGGTRPPPAAVSAETGPGQAVQVDMVAGSNSFAVQAGAGTTGSWVRDLVGALAGLAGLDNTQIDGATLQDYGARISRLLQGAAAAIATDQAGFGQIQSGLERAVTALSDTGTALTRQVAGAEEVDMATTASALAQAQIQLQASYKLIAGLRELSLVSYL